MADVAITKSKSITIRGGQIPSNPVIPETPEDPVTPVFPTIEAGIGLTKTANVIKLGDNVNHIFALEPTYKQFASFLQWAVNNHISLISGYSDVDRSETSVGAYNFTPMGSNNKQSVINLQRYLGSHASMSLKTINSNTGEEIGFLIRENEAGASVFEAVDDVELKGITYKADYSANYTDRSIPDVGYVNSVAGGMPPIDGSYASEAAMIADQASQTAQYIYFDGTSYWEYLGTTTPSIADYRQISGGGSDSNKVSYNVSDGKTASEQQQARDNIGMDTGLSQTVSTDANINNLARTNNLIIFTGGTVTRNLTGIVAGLDGEKVTLWNKRAFNILIQNNTVSAAANQFLIVQDFILLPEQRMGFVYNATLQKWVYDFDFVNRYLRKDVADSRTGTLTQNGTIIHNISGTTRYELRRSGTGAYDLCFAFYDDQISTTIPRIEIANTGAITNTSTSQSIFATSIQQSVKSQASNRLTRQDELHRNVDQTIATAGTLNNVAINDSTKLVLFSNATAITGIVGAAGRLLRIYAFGVNIIIRHENASSTAANRFSLPGAVDLTINNNECYTFIYALSRWRRVF